MALRPGQRVLFNGRMGTVKANRPAGMVDVQFDDRKTGERRSARDLRPVRSNPSRKLTQSQLEEAAAGDDSDWNTVAKKLLSSRVEAIKAAQETLKASTQKQRKLVSDAKKAEKRDPKAFRRVDRRMADWGEAVQSPEQRYAEKIREEKRKASELRSKIADMKKAAAQLSTGKYPNQRFSKAKAQKLRNEILSAPGTVPKGEPPQRRKQRRAQQIAAARAARRQAPKPIRVLPLPEQIKQQEAAFKIVPDRPRSSPDRLSECGNPIDGKAYVLAIKSESRTYPVWLKYSDLAPLVESNIGLDALAIMPLYRQGRRKLDQARSLEARRIKPEEATTSLSPWNAQLRGALPEGVKAVSLTQQRPANVRQRKRWISRADGTMGRQQAGVSQELHPRSRLPAPGLSTGSKLEENDPVLLQLPDGTVRGFVVQKSMDPFRQRLQQDFSPFPPYTTKGDNPFYSWVPEEAGELQQVLASTDPALGDAPCLTKSDKTQIGVANDAIRSVRGTFRNALSWHRFLGKATG